ncbi:MAG: HepT-like ribonuclease domain-containing protein [Pseudomonadota bacterium]
MSKDDLVYVGHMLDTARLAVSKIQAKTRRDFDADENHRMALAHLLRIVGEAARRVPRSFQERHPDVPWRAIIGMRHKVGHDY